MDQLKAYLTKRNIVALLIIAILALGLLVSIRLVQQQQQLKSKAAQETIQFGSPVDCSGPQCTTTSPTVDIEVTSPFGPTQP